MNEIQDFQNAYNRRQELILAIEKAKTQSEIYQKDIQDMLKSQKVSSIAELKALVQKELESLNAVTAKANEENEKAEQILAQLGNSNGN